MQRRRAAIYVRLSRETDTTTSPERQRADCLSEAERRGWDVVQIEEDVDVSATKRRLVRPGLTRIRENYANLDVVIFAKMDRLARSISDFSTLLSEALDAKVDLVSVAERDIDTTTTSGWLLAHLTALFAEMEARTIGARMKATNDYLRREGRAPGGIKFYGYKSVPNPDGPGKIHVPDETRAAALRDAAERILSGEALASVCRDFTSRGVPTSRGGTRWAPKSLKKMLTNPAALGYIMQGGRPQRGEDGRPIARWEPILDRRTFDAVGAVLAERGAPQAHPQTWRPDSWLLSGVAYCEKDGGRMYASRGRHRGGGIKEGYRCRECACFVDRTRLEDWAETDYLRTVGRMVVMKLSVPEETHAADDIAEVEAALADLAADRYERGLFRGDDGAARFSAMYEKLEERLALLQSMQDRDGGDPTYVTTGETHAEEWARSDVMSRRTILLQVGRVLVGPGAAGGRVPIEQRASWDRRGAEV